MAFPKFVRIVEVGLRDGLQNEPQFVETAVKINALEQLAHAGLKTIEATSFVSPTWVPQLADHAELMRDFKPHDGVRYPVLVPNLQGFEAAVKAGARDIALFIAASETFSQRNTHASIEQSLIRCAEIAEQAKKHQIQMRGYISCVLGCPYEGAIAPEIVVQLARRLRDLGCFEISLGDTIGVGTPAAAVHLVEQVAKVIPLEQLAAHFHDTYGQALVNLYAVLERGIAVVDSSVAGLGGCPYAKSATGNVATEDVLYLLKGLGIQTGVDLIAVAKTGEELCRILKRENASKAARALLRAASK